MKLDIREKLSKTKEYVVAHSDKIGGELVRLGYYTAGAAIAGLAGYYIGQKLTIANIETGMAVIHDRGIMKYFNPETGLEIGVNEATKLINELKWA